LLLQRFGKFRKASSQGSDLARHVAGRKLLGHAVTPLNFLVLFKPSASFREHRLNCDTVDYSPGTLEASA
jgi:hypothetical protein